MENDATSLQESMEGSMTPEGHVNGLDTSGLRAKVYFLLLQTSMPTRGIDQELLLEMEARILNINAFYFVDTYTKILPEDLRPSPLLVKEIIIQSECTDFTRFKASVIAAAAVSAAVSVQFSRRFSECLDIFSAANYVDTYDVNPCIEMILNIRGEKEPPSPESSEAMEEIRRRNEEARRTWIEIIQKRERRLKAEAEEMATQELSKITTTEETERMERAAAAAEEAATQELSKITTTEEPESIKRAAVAAEETATQELSNITTTEERERMEMAAVAAEREIMKVSSSSSSTESVAERGRDSTDSDTSSCKCCKFL